MSMEPGNMNDEMIKAHMRALADFDEICSDPGLGETRAYFSTAVAETDTKSTEFACNRKFVQDAMSAKDVSAEDFKDISIEMKQSDIDLLSVEWVNEWHRKKQAQATRSAEERRSFIVDSLNTANTPEKPVQPKIIPYRRFAYTAAAAAVGIMILIASLKPSSAPEKLFAKYYESFPAMTSVTRGDNASNQLKFEQAIDYYKTGRYTEAAAAFRLSSPENTASLFYLGLAELEIGNTDQAISALELAAEKQGTFYKESSWYLGLAWLKKGNKPEAARYFGTLAGTGGFYSKRAAEILRRLK